jgi:ubiquitin-protein ligase
MFDTKKKPPLGAQKEADRPSRLQSDFKRLSTLFASHPCISIKETSGSPPDKYHVLYRIDGLQKIRNSIEVKNEHIVEITLPQKYPTAAPVCTQVSPIFHPNISSEKIDTTGLWDGGSTLADLIVKIGEMICFQKFTTENPLSTEAAKWAVRNKNMLPLSNAALHYNEPVPSKDEKRNSGSIVQATLAQKEISLQEKERKTEGIVIGSDTSEISQDLVNGVVDIDKRDTALLHVEKDEDTGIVIAESVSTAPKLPPKENRKETINYSSVIKPLPPSSVTETQQPAPTQSKEIKKISGLSISPAVQRENSPEKVSYEAMEPRGDDGVFCWRCGSKNLKLANYCSACGIKIRQEISLIQSPIRRATILSILISVPVVIIAIGLAWVLSQQRPQTISATPAQTATAPEPPPAVGPTATAAPVAAEVTTKSVPKIVSSPVEVNKIPAPQTSSAEVEVNNKPATVTTSARKSVKLTQEQKQVRITETLKNAQLHLNLGSFDKAIDRFMYVLQLDPQNDDALDGLRKVRDAKDKAAADSLKKNF